MIAQEGITESVTEGDQGGEDLGQQDVASENEEDIKLLSPGPGNIKFTDCMNFRKWLRTEKKVKHSATKKCADCCSNLMEIDGVKENVGTYLRNVLEKQSKSTYNLKYWTVAYVNEYFKNTQGVEFFNF